MNEPLERIDCVVPDNDPLLGPLSALDDKMNRKNAVEFNITELTNLNVKAKEEGHLGKAALAQLLLYLYSIEKHIIDYEMSEKNKEEYKNTIENIFGLYSNLDDKLTHKDNLEIKLHRTSITYQDTDKMKQSLLIKAKEHFTGFSVQRPSPDTPLAKDEPITKNAAESQQNCFLSLFACFRRGNNPTTKNSTDYKLKKYRKKSSSIPRRTR